MPSGLLRPSLSSISRTSAPERMDEMDPQMSSVLAGRMALERLASSQTGPHRASVDRPGTLVRIAGNLVEVVSGVLLHRAGRDSRQPAAEGAVAKEAIAYRT
jgi:hypothetical protein